MPLRGWQTYLLMCLQILLFLARFGLCQGAANHRLRFITITIAFENLTCLRSPDVHLLKSCLKWI